MFGKAPDDPYFDELHPAAWQWLFESWAYEVQLSAEERKDAAVLTGAFFNPEMARQIWGSDGGVKLSDADFARSYEEHVQASEPEADARPTLRRRRRRRLAQNA